MQTDAPTDAVVVITCGVTDPALLIACIKTPPTSPNLENKSNLQDKILAGTPAAIYDNKKWPDAPQFYVTVSSINDVKSAPENCDSFVILIPIWRDHNISHVLFRSTTFLFD